ncbi:MAG: hypothetical protein IPI66_00080 [Chitinophagaceae bacterium]|nr:hypothetical protein [Chitinophagaceae bacterium]MBL0054615.1 hypothetical protein [Chitinophagaceae bacterium]
MKKYLIPFFLTGTLIMMVVMAMTGKPLKNPETPRGILDLEFAYNSVMVDKVVNTWASISSVDTIAAAKNNTGLDFLFLLFYAGFLYLASLKIYTGFGGAFGKAGKWIGRGALLAGVLDILENTGMLMSLNGHISDPVALLTAICATIKWVLAGVALLYVLTGAFALLRTRYMGR